MEDGNTDSFWLGVRRWAAPGLAVIMFVAAFAFGLRALPDLGTPRWGFFVVAGLLGAPSLLALASAEFEVGARFFGRSVSTRKSLEIATAATAANLLPFPGSVAVRTVALTRMGIPLRSATRVTSLIGVAWVGVSTTIVGTLQVMTDQELFGAALLTGGVLAMFATSRLLPSTEDVPPSAFPTVLAIETGFVVVAAVRFYLILSGMRVDVTPSTAASLTLAGVLSSAVGIFPGGLGIREVTAGLIAAGIGLAASTGALAASIARLADLIFFIPLTLGVGYVNRRKPHEEERDDPPPSSADP